MPSPGRDYNRPVIGYFMLFINLIAVLSKSYFGFTLFKSKKLIDFWVNFITNLFTYLNIHDCQLSVFTGPKNRPKGLILFGSIFDILNPSEHYKPPSHYS